MTQEELEKSYEKALNEAVKQLSYRDLSESLLTEKLISKGHSEDSAGYAVAYLTERNLLSDVRYAQSVIRSYSRRGYGARRIKQELKMRGVCSDDIEQAMSETETDFSLLSSLIDKKLKGDVSDKKDIQKTIAFLQRRGFSFSDIKTVLDEYINEHESSEFYE